MKCLNCGKNKARNVPPYGLMPCLECMKRQSKYKAGHTIEVTTQSIKDGRVQFASDMVQSHRQGQLSREYVELYPDKAEGMVKEGVITKRDVEKSKYVWKGDIDKWDRNKKADAEHLAKNL